MFVRQSVRKAGLVQTSRAGVSCLKVDVAGEGEGRRGMASAAGFGGRSSVSGITATVFGATGFVGRYVVGRLGRIGSQVVVPHRGDEHDVRHLKVMGDLGQIVPVPFHARDRESIARAVEHSNVVINLASRDYETKNFKFADVNCTLAHTIAEVCAEAPNVERFIHVSALAADEDSASEWARTKAVGEVQVRSAFPNATVLRPADIFGHEDRFINFFGWLLSNFNRVMAYNDGQTKHQPVHVSDVVTAVMHALRDPSTVGQVYDLAGPRTYTQDDICEMICAETKRDFNKLTVPKLAHKLSSRVWNLAPHPQVNPSKVELLYADNLLDANTPNKVFADLGIEPEALEEHITNYARRYMKLTRMMGVNMDSQA